MEARISLITLGVADLEQATAFYRDGLGFPLSSASTPAISFFRTGGVIITLFPWEHLIADVTGKPADHDGPRSPPDRSTFRGVTLAHNVRTRDEVAKVLATAQAAGATIVKPAQDAFWGGHSGYFADLDGHLWEVAWNPFFPISADGSLRLP